MVKDIFDYPPVERPYVAVRRFQIVMGEHLFNKLLDYLDCDYGGFVNDYGEKLVVNPNYLSDVIVDMHYKEWKKIHEQAKKRGGKACLD